MAIFNSFLYVYQAGYLLMITMAFRTGRISMYAAVIESCITSGEASKCLAGFKKRLPQVTMGFNNSDGRMNWMIWGTNILGPPIYIYKYIYVYESK